MKKEKLRAFFRFFISRLFLINLGIAIVVVILIFWLTLRWLDSYTDHDESAHVAVPYLYGETIEEGVDRLEDLGLEGIIVDSIYLDDWEPGVIFLQDPLPSDSVGHKVKTGRKVYLTVISKKPPLVTVPDLMGYSKRVAQAKLDALGMKVDYKIVPHQHDYVLGMYHKGKEISGDRKIPRGDMIEVEIGRGSADAVVVPRLVGLTIKEAESRIGSMSLTLFAQCDDCETVEDSTNAVIYKQDPPGGPNMVTASGSEITVFLSTEARIESDSTGGNMP